MKYTKDNIIGLRFKCENSKFIYTIQPHSDKIITVQWGDSTYQTTTYNINVALEFLSNGKWILFENESNNYEIY